MLSTMGEGFNGTFMFYEYLNRFLLRFLISDLWRYFFLRRLRFVRVFSYPGDQRQDARGDDEGF